MQINAYNSSSKTYNTGSTYGPQTSNGTLGMQDFLNLIMAQMTNQDPMSPMENTEFISQMAQFSSLQAMTDMREMTMQGQAANLIGKNVVVADYDSKGKLVTDEGIVERVTFYGGEIQLFVNDKKYSYYNLMEVKEVQKEDPPDEETGQ